MLETRAGDKILIVWSASGSCYVEEISAKAKDAPGVTVSPENLQRLELANHANSTFTKSVVAVSGAEYSVELLAKVLKLLKPEGLLYVPAKSQDVDKETILSHLKLSGFVNLNTTDEAFVGAKPKYEVGASVKLSFAKQSAEKKAAVWNVNGDDGEEEETIDPDELLDEEDRAKPDPSTLKVCSTTGKRKACKNCSCGLADELAAENDTKPKAEESKSSCGSCYLGDAFRCSTCPYLGMPAFKPGEKVKLTLQDDI